MHIIHFGYGMKEVSLWLNDEQVLESSYLEYCFSKMWTVFFLVCWFCVLIFVKSQGSSLFENSLCGCEDLQPQGGYTCEEQAFYGKCDAGWMLYGKYCFSTCNRCFCVGECLCVDLPADGNYTCQEQKEFGQCDADWMIEGDFCAYTCGRCSCVQEPSQACMLHALGSIPEASTILEVIMNSRILSDLMDVVASSGATYFLPSDQAWENFRNALPNSDTLFDNELLLSEFLSYHILPDVLVESSDLQEEDFFRSNHLDKLLIVDVDQASNSSILIDNNGREARVIKSDIEACGSLIHIVDNVLVPSTSNLVFECLQFALGFSQDTLGMMDLISQYPSLRQLIHKASEEPSSFFIPTTNAWEEFRDQLYMPELLFGQEDLLSEFVALHIIRGGNRLENLGDILISLHLDEELMLDAKKGTISSKSGNQASIVRKNMFMCNKVVNVIDSVLTPKTTQLPFECMLQALGASSQTASMIQLTQDSSILSEAVFNVTDGTLLIPNRNAWINLLRGMSNPEILLEEEDLLAQVLAYHFVEGIYTINELITLQNATSKHLEEGITITTSDGPEAIIMDTNGREAMVVEEDIQVCNSSMNVIDTVLLPSTTISPYECLMFTFETLPGISNFSQLISQSNEVKQLLRRQIAKIPHTFLVPSNNAIDEFVDAAIDKENVFQNPEVFEILFQFHVVEGSLSTRELFEAGDIPTLLFEEPIEFEYVSNFDFSKRSPLDRTSAIIMPDIQYCNMTIHILDHVLQPAITKFQTLLDSEDGLFRGLVQIPDEPIVTFKTLNEETEEYLGEEEQFVMDGFGGPVPELNLDFEI
eukprot:TRINITY_DN2710_c0_g1_i4.p1 TRINITY_DN2710_c0_g1~~TRINITY_DN2710_c0_g1_i4.p1  ORF type:complete len:817 (-),score=102.29 TRINITY_DN2710_c0_g1_i4:561-3011(-)